MDVGPRRALRAQEFEDPFENPGVAPRAARPPVVVAGLGLRWWP